MNKGSAEELPGFYGKLPCTGDFVQRRLSAEFIGTWDAWLQAAIHSTREELKDRWRDIYLTSPVWRFALSAGICGDGAYAGVMVPSVDRVGRYFPITVARALQAGACPLALATGLQGWFEGIEAAALQALKAALPVDQFDRSNLDLQFPAAAQGADFERMQEAGHLWRHVASLEGIGSDIALTAYGRIEQRLSPSSFWWSRGSERVPTGWIAVRGLPEPDLFLQMLGATGEDPPDDDEPSTQPTRARKSTAPVLHSAGVTHAGHTRAMNQDAHLVKDKAGLWVVADGMGGGRDGDKASLLVCDRLSGLPAGLPLAERVARARQTLAEVNTELAGSRSNDKVPCATTVVALIVDGTHYAGIWAGDSRLYRLRDDRIEQLTRDHSVVEEARANGNLEQFPDLVLSANVITRAVGGTEDFELDELQGDLQDGDRFLLCSDGVYREITTDELRAVLATNNSPEAMCAAFKELVLSRAARDNLTAVVVHIG
jgi:type VI secretion system protein ImpM